MSIELITFIVMLGVFLVGCFACKLPVSLSMVLSSISGVIVGGFIGGLDLTLMDALRHLVEGMFSYVDTILVISTAMVFMKVIEASGALDAVSSVIIEKFHKLPALMLCLIMIIVMFPGMITGSSTASVLSAGSIMAPRADDDGRARTGDRFHPGDGRHSGHDRTSHQPARHDHWRRHRHPLQRL